MKTTTSIKIDAKIRDDAAKLAYDMGLNLSSIINASLRNFITERRIVFSADRQLNPKTIQEIDSVRKDIKLGKNLVGPFLSSKDLKKSLLQ